MPIRDLLYLDFDKAASIWSQFEEGLVERTSITNDLGKDRSAGTKFARLEFESADLEGLGRHLACERKSPKVPQVSLHKILFSFVTKVRIFS